MYVLVQTMDGRQRHRLKDLSKLTTIAAIKEMLVPVFDVPVDRQRLFFCGKQLVDSEFIHNYSVRQNAVLQLLVRPEGAPGSDSNKENDQSQNGTDSNQNGESTNGNERQQDTEQSAANEEQQQQQPNDAEENELIDAGTTRSVYKVGDLVDAQSEGAWYEAVVICVMAKKSAASRQALQQEKSRTGKDEGGRAAEPCSVQQLQDMPAKGGAVQGVTAAAAEAVTGCCSQPKEQQGAQPPLDDGAAVAEHCILAKNGGAATVGSAGERALETSSSVGSAVTGQADHKDSQQHHGDGVVTPSTRFAEGDMAACNDQVHSDASANDVEPASGTANALVSHASESKVTSDQCRVDGVGALVTNVVTQRVDDCRPSIGTDAVAIKAEVQFEEDALVYRVRFESNDTEVEAEVAEVRSKQLRPRARIKLSAAELDLGQRVMVNYNPHTTDTRGQWYDGLITRVDCRSRRLAVFCTVFIGEDLMQVDDCKLKFPEEIYKIEEPGSQSNVSDEPAATLLPLRICEYNCDRCEDNDAKKCKECACSVCGGKDRPELQIICDECNMATHISCLTPPLDCIPTEDDWYCPDCRNDADIVKAGQAPKESRRKAKMPSANPRDPNRDWGKGMACVGLTKECTVVKPNHFGPIPGVPVGSSWKYRLQVSEAGVHRPHVAGIHGREEEGAFSICLAGGYEDDEDNGDTFIFSGSGGRDLSGNKRTAGQSCDQKLTRMNKALAKNLNQPLDDKKGSTARDWKAGKAIRVVRSSSNGKNKSKYAPEEGNRYDGIYKLTKYWPERGRSGHLIWRYKFKRDDPTPAPWTKEGQALIKQLGLRMQYPEGQNEKDDADAGNENNPDQPSDSRKRKHSSASENEGGGASKSTRLALEYKPSEELLKLIKLDVRNKKLWDEVLAAAPLGEQKLLGLLQESFLCMCCQEVVLKPITTDCAHNICKECLTRSFRAEVYTCPQCRNELGKNYSMSVNEHLSGALALLLPGYSSGR